MLGSGDDDLFSADPEKTLKRAVNDARFARDGFEKGHSKKGLLLLIRGLEKILMFHCMKRNIPYPRDKKRLKNIYENLGETDLYRQEYVELCEVLDMFQNEQEEEILDIIENSEKFQQLKEEKPFVPPSEQLEDPDSELDDWELGEWNSEGWERNQPEREQTDKDKPEESEAQQEEHASKDADQPVEVTRTLFNRAQTFFKSLLEKTH